MVDRNLIRSLENDPELKAVFQAALEDATDMIVSDIEAESDFDVNKIVEGRIVRVDGDSVLVDVGYKSEGTISRDEWEDGEGPQVHGKSAGYCAPPSRKRRSGERRAGSMKRVSSAACRSAAQVPR